MWWLICSTPDFLGKSPRFESGIFSNDPVALRDHCGNTVKSRGREGKQFENKKLKFYSVFNSVADPNNNHFDGSGFHKKRGLTFLCKPNSAIRILSN